MDTSKLSINPDNLLCFLVGPFVLGIVAVDYATQSLIELGQASEEVFRGNRLPVLNFPQSKHKE